MDNKLMPDTYNPKLFEVIVKVLRKDDAWYDLDESELRCLDCGTIFEPEDWLSPECPECTSKNYEG